MTANMPPTENPPQGEGASVKHPTWLSSPRFPLYVVLTASIAGFMYAWVVVNISTSRDEILIMFGCFVAFLTMMLLNAAAMAAHVIRDRKTRRTITGATR